MQIHDGKTFIRASGLGARGQIHARSLEGVRVRVLPFGWVSCREKDELGQPRVRGRDQVSIRFLYKIFRLEPVFGAGL